MNRMKTRVMLFVGLGLLGGMVQRAAADDFDQKTVFTFSGPVEIPGQVLSAGTTYSSWLIHRPTGTLYKCSTRVASTREKLWR